MVRIAVVALPGCVASSVAGPLDIFAAANALGRGLGIQPVFQAEVWAVDANPVASFHGLRIDPARAADTSPVYDLVLLPAMFGLDGVEEPQPEAVAFVSSQHGLGAVCCAVCAGVFTLAATGVLRGREATTHWNLAEAFKRRFPEVLLTPERLLVDCGDVMTAGGVTAYLDLCLHIVARYASPELAALCAKVLLVDPGRRSQTVYAVHQAPLGHGDQAVLRVQDWLEERLVRQVRLEEAARVAGLSVRTLLRRFAKATGDTPNDYLARLRMEAAKRLLETTARPVDDVAESVGYGDTNGFRRAFKMRTGLTPGAYRKRFSLL